LTRIDELVERTVLSISSYKWGENLFNNLNPL